jgi:hypothetical protein
MMKLDIAKEAIRSAFLPFWCTIENVEDGSGVRFQVLNEKGNVLLTVERAENRRICDAVGFRTIVCTARAKLEKRGFHLLAWDSHLSIGLSEP